ncbi:DUF2157 domain-containing protein [Chamaesiphon sp. OTE_75_metabat_556]|uniref:DUF2157 domain-containing protein n=1 Tax=Chamaesiphon sp. OTE_75_metabat_556 TaxID=2964692 RepID=UPI00286B338D|nr:DUF2157 domain-containing protein [Chamaesiphon sp. OTE_75_metabat_556]
MQNVKFRQTLRQEANRWRSEGFIDSDFHAKLADRYQFDSLDAEASGTFISAMIGLGGVLIGLGILSFVALNWQYLDKPYRIVVLLGALLAVNAGGFYLWQKSPTRRLGQGLLVLGSIIFGADLALLAQLFHVSGDTFILFMGWAIGVLLMAYALKLPSLGAISIALMGCGYWGAAVAGFAERSLAPVWAQGLYEYMPILSIVMFLPLAYRCRSPLIFSLGAIAWLSAFLVAADNYSFKPYPLGIGLYSPETEFILSGAATNMLPVILGCSLPILLFWAAGRVQGYFPTPAYRPQFARFSQRMAVFSGSLICFYLSLDSSLVVGKKYLDSIPWDFLLLVGVTIGLWVALWRLSSRWQPTDLLVLAWGVSIAGLLAVGLKGDIWWILTVRTVLPAIFFLLLAAITLICIRTSLQTADRGAFYFGWLLLSLRILTWFAFVQTDLSLKALLFIASGAVTIALGVWFERRLRLVS